MVGMERVMVSGGGVVRVIVTVGRTVKRRKWEGGMVIPCALICISEKNGSNEAGTVGRRLEQEGSLERNWKKGSRGT